MLLVPRQHLESTAGDWIAKKLKANASGFAFVARLVTLRGGVGGE